VQGEFLSDTLLFTFASSNALRHPVCVIKFRAVPIQKKIFRQAGENNLRMIETIRIDHGHGFLRDSVPEDCVRLVLSLLVLDFPFN
jgi:hypothetical protein